MDNKENHKFPKGFFKESRPSLSTKEALRNVTLFNWSKNILKGNSKVKIVSEKDK